MNHSTRKPTKAEAQRMTDALRLGCAACASLNIWSPAHEIHHIVEGNKRLGHLFVLPLCRGHHRGAWDDAQRRVFATHERVSIADGRKAFTAVYPTERQLWETVQQRLHLPAIWPTSKILPRRTTTERTTI